MYKIILAIRYLLKRRISYFSIAAVALCVFVVFVVITVLSGLAGEFKRNVHASVGDCVISSDSLVGFAYYEEFMNILDKEKIIEAVSPVIKNYGLIKVLAVNEREIDTQDTAEIIGIDPGLHVKVTGFGDWLYYHKENPEDAFVPDYGPDFAGCVPGIDYLFSRDSQGRYNVPENIARLKFQISSFPLTAKGALAKAGAGLVNTKTFYYSDITHSGVAAADWKRIYLPFEQAQILCGMADGPKRVNAIYAKFKPDVSLSVGCNRVKQLWDEFAVNKGKAKYAGLLKNVKVRSWKDHNRAIVAAMETEQTMMIICFAMVGIIAAFIVFVVLYMIVCHKTKDIGILKSIGASNGGVLSLFLFFSFLMALTGSVIGAVGGWQFLVHINRIEDWLFEHFGFQLWDRTIYAIDDIPNTIDLKVLTVIIVSAFSVCLVGAFLPSRQASKYQPVETLQVNQL